MSVFDDRLREFERNTLFMIGKKWMTRYDLAPLPTLARIADGGLREAPEYRPRVFGYLVSARTMRRRTKLGYRPPWGWTHTRQVVTTGRTDNFLVGPVWMLWPRAFVFRLYVAFIEWAVRVDLARPPYEACYYSELIWFPDQPRFE